jgi:hypothetical protein
MTTQPARDDLVAAQRARALRTVRVLAVVAAGIYVFVMLRGVLHP